MNEVLIDSKNEIVIKLLHYFVTEKNYSPVILQGASNEIWLQNLNGDHKIIRIVSGYIHNDEQLKYDIFKTKHIVNKIKKKTLSLKMPVLSIFIDLGENVNFDEIRTETSIDCIYVKNENDLDKYSFVIDEFPDIDHKLSFKEKGLELFMRITADINKKNEKENKVAEKVFRPKKPYITYGIISVCVALFIAMYIFGDGSENILTLIKFGATHGDLVRYGDWWRLFSSAFIHIGIAHLIINMYSLYIIGTQIEGFIGKFKYLTVYLFSAGTGALLSGIFGDYLSAGASGAIFGLMGALLYFGYHYRVYLGNVIRSQIIPLIILNLAIGFMIEGIDNAAHIGGLIGGVLIAVALGVEGKSTSFEKINGWIMSIIYSGFLLYLMYFY